MILIKGRYLLEAALLLHLRTQKAHQCALAGSCHADFTASQQLASRIKAVLPDAPQPGALPLVAGWLAQ
jgi:hypothetical protein